MSTTNSKTSTTAATTTAKPRRSRKPAAIAAPQPILLLPARCASSEQQDERNARRAAARQPLPTGVVAIELPPSKKYLRSAARTAAVARGKAAGAAAATAAMEALNAQRRALFSQHIPTQTLPETARQSLYAKDMTQYKLTMSDPLSMTVIFKVSPVKRVVWFKLDGVYVRECIADGKPVHLTVFRTPEAAEIPEAPAGAESLNFAA